MMLPSQDLFYGGRRIKHFVDTYGDADALALMESFAGSKMGVTAVIDGSRLAEKVGLAIAERVRSRVAGRTRYIAVPIGLIWRTKIYLDRGMSPSAIAAALNCDLPHVISIINALNGDEVPESETLPSPTDEVKKFCDIIGRSQTLRLSEAYGGRRLYIGGFSYEKSAVIGTLSIGSLCALVDHFDGSQIMIPVARRWRTIIYRQRGMSYSQIARATGSSERTVYRLLKEQGLT